VVADVPVVVDVAPVVAAGATAATLIDPPSR